MQQSSKFFIPFHPLLPILGTTCEQTAWKEVTKPKKKKKRKISVDRLIHQLHFFFFSTKEIGEWRDRDTVKRSANIRNP